MSLAHLKFVKPAGRQAGDCLKIIIQIEKSKDFSHISESRWNIGTWLNIFNACKALNILILDFRIIVES